MAINDKLLKSAAGGGGLVNSANFQTVLYTGNGATTQAITGVGFKPEFVWIKQRSGTASHTLQDIVRGEGSSKTLSSDLENVQGDYGPAYGFLSTFDNDGFTVGEGSASGAAHTNKLNSTYVAWCWMAGGAKSTNTAGSIDCELSANVDAGFSIATYTNILNNYTYSHGLSKAPEIIITKGLDVVYGWEVAFPDTFGVAAGSTAPADWNRDFLNEADPLATNPYYAADANFIYNGGWTAPFPTMVSYNFHSVAGFSKMGSYTGTGANQHIDCGFEPAWVMIKNTENSYRWYILDNKRNPTNPKFARLFANAGTAEATNANILDFTTTGFQIITSDAEVNQNNKKMIFMAFAADPDTTTPTLAKSFNIDAYSGNGATQQIGSVNTLFTKYAVLNGSSSRIQIPAIFSSGYSGSLSYSCWFRTSVTDSNLRTVIEPGEANSNGNFTIHIINGKLRLSYYNLDGSATTDGSTTVSDGKWHNLVAVLNNSTGKLDFYLDGKTTAEISRTFTAGSTIDAFANQVSHFGVSFYQPIGYFRYLNGSIDQVRIYNTALTQSQVTELYNETQASASTLNFPTGAGGKTLYEFNNDATSTSSSSYNGSATNVTYDSFLFKPDLVIIKARNSDFNWSWTDTVRGAGNFLMSNFTDANIVNENSITAFNNAGFTLGTGVKSGTANSNGFNKVNDNYVAYSFKMLDNNNNVPIVMDGGTVDSLVSANPSAGMSVVKFTNAANGTSTVSHGLSSVPELIIMKQIDAATNWVSYNVDGGAGRTLILNNTNAYSANNASVQWGSVPTSSLFTVTNNSSLTNGSKPHIAYCFHSVSGFSKIGTYEWTATSYTVGTCVTGLGFSPDFVIIKRINAAGNWQVYGSERGSGDQRYALYFDDDDAESTDGYQAIKFDSNGFSTLESADGHITGGSGINEKDGIYLYWAMKIN